MGSAQLSVVPTDEQRPVKQTAVSKARRNGPRSVTRLLNVLRVLALSEESVSLAQLSLATRTPKTSLLALLRTLVDAGYIVQREAGYMLGAEAFALGSVIIGQRRLAQLARPVLQRLAEQSGETILLAELSADSTHAIYIDKVESTRAIRFIASVGERRPLYGSACGRALLAFQDDAFRKNYLSGTRFIPLNPNKKMMSRGELEGIIKDIRKNSLATTNEDVNEGVVGFGSPIFGRDGETVAAIAIGAPVVRGLQQAKVMSRLVKDGAREISRTLGYIEKDA